MEQFGTYPAYSMEWHSAGHNPADSTTYFIGNIPAAPTVTAGAPYRVYFPRSGRIRKIAVIGAVFGTLGSGETGTVSLEINNTTSYQITNQFTWSAIIQSTGSVFEDDTAPVIEQNDYFQVRVDTPAWATNPTSVIYWGSLWIEA